MISLADRSGDQRLPANRLIAFIFTAFLFSIFPDRSPAMVRGTCGLCHTMHNSQNGSGMVYVGSGSGWNGAGQLAGGPVGPPQKNLTVTDCAGCHTSVTGQTVITVDTTSIPIVFNTGGYPAQPLAGGNFYHVSQGGPANDAYGHNVYGISLQDERLSSAPGFTIGACGSAGRCHVSLAMPPLGTNWERGGCQGCHVFTYHHEDNEAFRFLKSHGAGIGSTLIPARKNITLYPDFVRGVEDDDWEEETGVDHNDYQGTDAAYASDGNALTNQQTVTAFCAGCHGQFHGPMSGSSGMGSSSPWLRHPTDILLPETGEYGGYDPLTSYNNRVPVGYTDPANPTRASAVVMCLSCHRAHGSEHPSILRWDYSTCETGTSTAGCGCFTCHTNKDS